MLVVSVLFSFLDMGHMKQARSPQHLQFHICSKGLLNIIAFTGAALLKKSLLVRYDILRKFMRASYNITAG